jgi:hypothetical protein
VVVAVVVVFVVAARGLLLLILVVLLIARQRVVAGEDHGQSLPAGVVDRRVRDQAWVDGEGERGGEEHRTDAAGGHEERSP